MSDYRIREMQPKERKIIEKMMEDNPFIAKNIIWELVKEAAFIIAFFAVLIGLIVGIGMLGMYLSNVSTASELMEFGYDLGLVVALGVIYKVITNSWTSAKEYRIRRKVYLDEIASNKVKEFFCNIAEVKVGYFSDCEEIVYFLLLDDRRVYVLYDDKKENLSDSHSHFLIREKCLMVNSFDVDWLISVEFSGEMLNIPQSFKLPDDLDKCPDNEAFCDTPWEDIEKHYAA